MEKKYNIAVAGTGYVGLSIATLLAQHHKVTAVDIIESKVEMLNNHKPPIQDEYIEKYLADDVSGIRFNRYAGRKDRIFNCGFCGDCCTYKCLRKIFSA